jgi:hypothetical protein
MSKSDLSWREAILQVLNASTEAMHYSDITKRIVDAKLRTSLGATPASTVNAVMTDSIVKEGDKSPFVRVSKGRYWLRSLASGAVAATPPPKPSVPAEPEVQPGFIQAFGMYWSRDKVNWKAKPTIYGRQQPTSALVDFAAQRGVYMLHDGRSVVYVGRTQNFSLGERLFIHTYDRLKGRWDRFSWFGIDRPNPQGTGLIHILTDSYNQDELIATMEALLIEGLEPPQNRKRGDDLGAVEFIQSEDPALKRKKDAAFIADLLQKHMAAGET